MASDNDKNRNKSPWDDEKPIKPTSSSDIDDLFRRSQSSFNNIYDKFKKNDNFSNNEFKINKFIGIIALFLFLFWAATGFYAVDEGEQALVVRFGKYQRTASTGLNYHLPEPIEYIIKEKVDTLRKEEIGFRGTASKDGMVYNSASLNNSLNIKEESLMLTGDQNIIEINFIIQWRISNLKDYVFNIYNTRETVRNIAESAMREIIGNTPIDKAITEGRSSIEQEAKALVQNILNSYQAGVEITTLKLLKADPPEEVIDSFRDVQTAKTDKEREINRAYSFQNEIIPKARGDAAKIILESEAYRTEIVEKAKGDAERFDLILTQYSKAKDLTRKRIFLETMDSLLQGMDKIIIDNPNGVVPYLPLKPLEGNK